MYATRAVHTSCRSVASRQSAARFYKVLSASTTPLTTSTSTLKPAACIGLQSKCTVVISTSRSFSTTPARGLKEFFPAPDSPHIKTTPAAWPHPVYSEEQMNAIKYSHREAKTMSDRVALMFVRALRWGLDLASGYRHASAEKLAAMDPDKAKKFQMTETKYMIRNIFLESVAGVPGIVAGMLRHLRSMRRMERDNGWMETLLEESYNERMHLLTFLKMAEPGPVMRFMVLGAQGVFFNAFFLSYLISPRTAHRFVGYIEEEAVLTYTREIEDLEAGKLPRWERCPVPDIAVQYWKMPEGSRTMRDLLQYIRADEAKHREVNHTLANLDQRRDPNPFVSNYKDPQKPHPGGGIEHIKPQGWEREEVI